MMRDTCECCKWYFGSSCHKNAPSPLTQVSSHSPATNTFWPKVNSYDWCGEFEREEVDDA